MGILLLRLMAGRNKGKRLSHTFDCQEQAHLQVSTVTKRSDGIRCCMPAGAKGNPKREEAQETRYCNQGTPVPSPDSIHTTPPPPPLPRWHFQLPQNTVVLGSHNLAQSRFSLTAALFLVSTVKTPSCALSFSLGSPHPPPIADRANTDLANRYAFR